MIIAAAAGGARQRMSFIKGEIMLPKDPYILLSYVNMKLRNSYVSLSEFCKAEDADESELTAALAAVGYYYDSSQNAFKNGA